MTAVRNGEKEIILGNLIVHNIILCNCLFTKKQAHAEYKHKDHNVENVMEVSLCHSWIWKKKNPHIVNATQQERELLQKR